MTITPLPTPPARTDGEATFVSRANAFLGALPTFGTEANALAAAVSADKAATQTAAAIAPVSLAAANFKGNWSALTGALAVPASVFHSGAFWTLASDLADVTAKEPGVDVEWLELETGGVEPDYQEFTASGTWTKPEGVTVVYVEAIGGGGSGGVIRSSGTTANGSGGAGGAFGFKVYRAADLGATAAVVVGAGGASVVSTTDASGNSGGNSTFNGEQIGTGGGGGGTSVSSASGAWGSYFSGTGTRSGSGQDSFAGGGGGGGASTSTAFSGGTSVLAGNGGDSARENDADATAQAGSAPGGGGGLASIQNFTTTRTGTSGAGGAGRARVWAW
jgi:hypothetical protein